MEDFNITFTFFQITMPLGEMDASAQIHRVDYQVVPVRLTALQRLCKSSPMLCTVIHWSKSAYK